MRFVAFHKFSYLLVAIILQGLSQRQKDQQEALWELLYTEVEYIKALYVIHDVSISHIRCIRVFGVFATEIHFGREIC